MAGGARAADFLHGARRLKRECQLRCHKALDFTNRARGTMNETSATHYRWDDLPRERVTDKLDRKLITGDRMMLAHVYLAKGCIVPKHSHENEQLTYILEGALRFTLGEDQALEVTVSAGEVLHIPSNLPHRAEALEDTLDVDIFSPPREDWINKTDDYLRK